MLVEDRTKYCWVDGEIAGEPQGSIKDAIADYLNDVKKEHIAELSEELTKVFRAWEKKYGFENNALVVFETNKYRISDYIDK